MAEHATDLLKCQQCEKQTLRKNLAQRPNRRPECPACGFRSFDLVPDRETEPRYRPPSGPPMASDPEQVP